jgi:hypothetical protein
MKTLLGSFTLKVVPMMYRFLSVDTAGYRVFK